MKKRFCCFQALLFLLSLIFFSCSSTPEKKIDSVYVMVYDYDNSTVMDAKVFVNDKFLGCTDIYGRFMFAPSATKEYDVRVEKKGYETLSMTSKLQAGMVLYFKIGSGKYYAERAEEALDKNDLNEASKMIEKSIEIEDRKDWKFLQEIINRRIDK